MPGIFTEADEPETIGELINDLGDACEEFEEIKNDIWSEWRKPQADLDEVIREINAFNGWVR